MPTCANCTAEAKYTQHVNDAILVHYCEKHLPHFLQEKKRAGLLPLLTPPVEPEKPAKKKKEEPVVVEAVAEEPVVEAESAPADADN